MDRPAFPADLLAAQQELHETAAALSALYDRLPWSVETHDGFKDPDIWRPRERPATEGWSQEDQAEVQRLLDRRLELTITVSTHDFWTTLEGPDRVTARRMLKHAHDTPAAETPAA
ncbi:hypothetical protein AB0E27_38535 [Streptomyces sparsogenes]|uniref:hypothetical protein n=1 Tax=Streptomyces sparsogenes TaxID=67365 RepID=UPI00340E1EC5